MLFLGPVRRRLGKYGNFPSNPQARLAPFSLAVGFGPCRIPARQSPLPDMFVACNGHASLCPSSITTPLKLPLFFLHQRFELVFIEVFFEIRHGLSNFGAGEQFPSGDLAEHLKAQLQGRLALVSQRFCCLFLAGVGEQPGKQVGCSPVCVVQLFLGNGNNRFHGRMQ